MPKVQTRDSSRGDGNPKSSVSRGGGNWSSGRVGKPYAKAAEDRKLKTTVKNKVTDKGSAPSQHPEKNENEKDDPLVYKQKMTIAVNPERKCTDKEIEQIQDALIDAFETLEDGLYPQFYGSFVVKGSLVVTCANEQTKLWLERIVPNLEPWEGAKGKLCVKVKGEIMQGTKVLLKTPKLFAKTDPKKILQMLSTQNKTLDTSTWKNVSAKSEDSGQTLIYTVDSKSLEAIRALGNKVYLGLGNVELVIVDNEGDKKTSADTSKDDKKVSADAGKDDKKASADTGEDDKKASADTGEDDKKASADTGEDGKKASADTGEDGKKASADTGEDGKKASADTGEDDKKASADTGEDDKKASADKGEDDKKASADKGEDDKVSADTGKDDKKASADTGKDDMEVSVETIKAEK